MADVTQKLRDGGERLASEQKTRAAQGLQGVGESIREAAGRFQQGPLGEVGTYMEAAAERVSRASEYLEEHDVPDLLREAGQVVMRRPQLFLWGMFITGLLVARFLKATEAEPDRRGAAGEQAPRRARPQSRRPQRQPTR